MRKTEEHPSIAAAKRRQEPEIVWRFTPRLEPREYSAYCRSAKIYYDRSFRRWVCAVQFDALSDDRLQVLGRVTWFLNLGKKDKATVTRRGNYWIAWNQANGGPPRRNDRMSPKIFTRRYARVIVADTAKTFNQSAASEGSAYSVVRSVVCWETGGREP